MLSDRINNNNLNTFSHNLKDNFFNEYIFCSSFPISPFNIFKEYYYIKNSKCI